MKLNKTIGRVATTLVATAMLASLVAVPAFAEDNPGYFEKDVFTITKHLVLPENSFTPTKQFNFVIAPADKDIANEQLTEAELEVGTEYGPANGVDSLAYAAFQADPAETVAGKGGKTVSTVSTDIAVDVEKFDHAGRYKYIVTEQSFDDDDFKYEENKLVLYVNIKNAKDDAGKDILSVDYVELVDPDATTGSLKIDGFTNTYGVDNEETPKLHNIELKKVISGDAANMNASFDFTIKVDTQYENNVYVIVDTNGSTTYGDTVKVDGKDVADQVVILKDNEPETISLSNNETAMIYNLNSSDVYTIVENKAGEDGYTTTVTGDSIDDGTEGQVSGSITADTEITYENKKISTPATGIVMNVAPYALLVVIAAAGCFVFLRKRRED